MGVPDYISMKLYSYNCCRLGCDAIVILPDSVDNRLRESGESFYCYRGHSQSYSDVPTKDQRLRKEAEAKLKKKEEELARKEEQLRLEVKRKEWALQAERKADYQRRAAKGQLTKAKNRIRNGVCPCCNRTFAGSRLAKHMATKHPDYGKGESK